MNTIGGKEDETMAERGEWLVTVGGSSSPKYATVIGRYHSYGVAVHAAAQERSRLVRSGIRCGVESVDEFVASGGVLP